MAATLQAPPAAVERHQLYEDALAMLMGTLFIALGMLIYSKTMLLTGSTAGLALLPLFDHRLLLLPGWRCC